MATAGNTTGEAFVTRAVSPRARRSGELRLVTCLPGLSRGRAPAPKQPTSQLGQPPRGPARASVHGGRIHHRPNQHLPFSGSPPGDRQEDADQPAEDREAEKPHRRTARDSRTMGCQEEALGNLGGGAGTGGGGEAGEAKTVTPPPRVTTRQGTHYCRLLRVHAREKPGV